MNNQIHTLLLVFLESVSYIIAFIFLLRIRSSKLRILLYIASTSIIWVTNSFYAFNIKAMFLKSVMIILTNLIISMVFFYASIFARFYVVAFTYTLIVAADALLLAFCSIFISPIEISTNKSFALLLSILPKIFVIIVLLILKTKFFRGKIYEFRSSPPAIFSITLLLVNMYTVIHLSSNPFENAIATFLTTISLLIMNLLFYYFVRLSYQQTKEDYEKVLLKQQLAYQMTHINEISTLYDKQKRFMHDYRNFVATVKQLLIEEKHLEALGLTENLTKDLIFQHYEFYTGHDLIDSILNVKASECKEYNINLKIYSNNLSNIGIKDIDLISLITNLLDNAIDASMQVLSPKEITIKFENSKGSLLISIANPTCKEPVFEHGKLITSKSDKQIHGIGFIIIESILNKYNADYEIFTGNNNFQFVTIINYEQVVGSNML